MNIISYTIEFGLSKYNKNIAVFPFSIVYQTNSQKIEKYCKTTWPKLMTHEMYTPQDNLDKYKMYKYIKDNLTSSDLIDLHKIAFEKNWMAPLEYNDNNSKCEVIEYGCKTWSNPNVPYLELKGFISIDMLSVFETYMKKNWITFESKTGILSESPFIKINKSLPFIMRYNGSQTPFDILLTEVIKQSKEQNSSVNKMLIAKTKLKDIHTYEKKIVWGLDKNTIIIELTEKIRLLKDKTLADPVKYGLLGLGVHHLTKNLSSSQKAVTGAATYLYMKRKK